MEETTDEDVAAVYIGTNTYGPWSSQCSQESRTMNQILRNAMTGLRDPFFVIVLVAPRKCLDVTRVDDEFYTRI